MVIEVVRIGQRVVRDDRVTTHVALVSRAFGAERIFMTEVNPEIMKAVLGDDEVVNVEVHKLPRFEGDEQGQKRRRLLIANDPDSKWVYVDIYDGDEKQAAERYMSHVLNNAPFHIRKILAGNYNEFLSRFRLLEDE